MPIGILLLICIYCVLACEFQELRIRVEYSQDSLDKINDIVKNLSFSYIAGVIFFLLSDTIPYCRRKKITLKYVEKAMSLMLLSIDDFTINVNGKKWDSNTEPYEIYEDISGAIYEGDSQIKYTVPDNVIISLQNLYNSLNMNIDFILAQELYIDDCLLDMLEQIKSDKRFQYSCGLSLNANTCITIYELVEIFKLIISIKSKLLKYQ